MFTPRPENVELSLYEPYGCHSQGSQLDLAGGGESGRSRGKDFPGGKTFPESA